MPLRTSPKSTRWSGATNFPPSDPAFGLVAPPRTITPGNSDSDSPSALDHSAWAPEPELPRQQSQPCQMDMGEVDHDMDMMDLSEPVPQHDQTGTYNAQQQEQHLQPGPLQPDTAASNLTGRMPTPIHCSFAEQVRGKNWGGAAGNMHSGNFYDSTSHVSNSTAFNDNSMVVDVSQGMGERIGSGEESIPRSLDGESATGHSMLDWSMLQNRRLPSPISESGGEDNGLESPQMMLDSQHFPRQQQHTGHLSHLTHQHPLISSLPSRGNLATIQTDQHSNTTIGREGTPGEHGGMDVEGSTSPSSSTPSPGKKFGHTRSKHTISSWTNLQPGMKRSFAIGYRADCEKCKNKVPGHFNHIIVS